MAYLYSYFSIYIFFFPSFKDQMEGARLLALIAESNSWPASIFSDLKYENNY
jgi:hypothetical protein